MASGSSPQVSVNKIVQRLSTKKGIHGAIINVAVPSQNVLVTSASGNLNPQTPYYIASINKMMIAALIFRLAEKDAHLLHRKISSYLTDEEYHNLLVLKKKDHSHEISIWNLVTQTSGLPCYLQDKLPESISFIKSLSLGEDATWDLPKVLNHAKKLKPKFVPGQKGKAYYSNTNFRLLAKVIERIEGKPVRDVLNELFIELSMEHSFVFDDRQRDDLLPVFVNGSSILPSKYFSSTGYDIYSTAEDQPKFLKGFFDGYFFPKSRIREMQQWNKIFFPMQYGAGLQRFTLPRALTPFKPFPEMIGHAGSVGSFAFYVPQKDLFITGTINQSTRVRLAFKALVSVVNACKPAKKPFSRHYFLFSNVNRVTK